MKTRKSRLEEINAYRKYVSIIHPMRFSPYMSSVELDSEEHNINRWILFYLQAGVSVSELAEKAGKKKKCPPFIK